MVSWPIWQTILVPAWTWQFGNLCEAELLFLGAVDTEGHYSHAVLRTYEYINTHNNINILLKYTVILCIYICSSHGLNIGCMSMWRTMSYCVADTITVVIRAGHTVIKTIHPLQMKSWNQAMSMFQTSSLEAAPNSHSSVMRTSCVVHWLISSQTSIIDFLQNPTLETVWGGSDAESYIFKLPHNAKQFGTHHKWTDSDD